MIEQQYTHYTSFRAFANVQIRTDLCKYHEQTYQKLSGGRISLSIAMSIHSHLHVHVIKHTNSFYSNSTRRSLLIMSDHRDQAFFCNCRVECERQYFGSRNMIIYLMKIKLHFNRTLSDFSFSFLRIPSSQASYKQKYDYQKYRIRIQINRFLTKNEEASSFYTIGQLLGYSVSSNCISVYTSHYALERN